MSKPPDVQVNISLRVGRRTAWVLAALVVAIPTAIFASSVGTLNVFANDTVADANAVNGNFANLKGAVNDNHSRLASLEGVKPPVACIAGQVVTWDGAKFVCRAERICPADMV